MEAAALKCPNGDGELKQVRAPARLGMELLLDQCGGCGGIWFDRFELFQLNESQAAAIDRVDNSSFRFPAGAVDEPHCPRCGRALFAFKDPNIPANIQMFICGDCEGIWLNHGLLAEYASFRLERGHQPPDPQKAAEYEAMLAVHQGNMDFWRGMESYGRALSERVDPLTMLPLEGSAADKERIDRAHDAAFTFAGWAMRLLFGWL